MQLLIGHGQVPTIMPEASYFFGFNICRRWICSYKSWASKCGICGCAGNLDCDMFWVLSEWET